MNEVSRIVFQATLLAQFRKLSIWYRPEPSGPVLSRRARSSEEFLARTLMQYLQHLLDSSSRDIIILIRCRIIQQLLATSPHHPTQLRSPHSTGSAVMELRIKTPQFYRQMITYRKLSIFLTYALLEPFEENRTACSSDSDRLIALVEDLESAQERSASRSRLQQMLLRVSWNLYDQLRTTKELIGAYPYPGLPKTRNVPVGPTETSRRDHYFMDEFVRNHSVSSFQIYYLMAVLSLQLRVRVMRMIGGE